MSEDAGHLLRRLLLRWRAALPETVTDKDLADFLRRNKAEVFRLIEQRRRVGPRARDEEWGSVTRLPC